MKTELLVTEEIQGYQYPVDVTCSNCGWKARVGIIKGDTIDGWLGMHYCPRCHCVTLSGKYAANVQEELGEE